jgi:LytS/YehU family sensor histidine kinase
MALLALVENAVRHDIDPSEQGGHIEVGAARDEAARATRVWVRDIGMGLAPQAAEGTGLANLRERLAVFFDGAARRELKPAQPAPPRGRCARIVIVGRPRHRRAP